MDKRITFTQAAQAVNDGSSLMVSGFLDAGHPQNLIRALREKNVRDITLISLDAGNERCEVYYFIQDGHVGHMIVSHIGRCPAASDRVIDGSMTLEFSPQGTLCERIRAGGAGLGGFLTPSGIGTEVEKGKQIIEVAGKPYILETTLRADVAFIRAQKADRYGNLYFRGNTRNFNVAIATAADYVVAEVLEYSDEPLPGESVHIPGLFVDAIAVVEDK
ncbi:MAG: 3-oxoacid CoA-transferase subunit A [Propionibacteriaceae bacterium]|nr:3-oxoacid CoA-transferase subunit A [Propionibacteriaceae bacterium]